MKRVFLGEFEEVVLLAVAILDEGAYGVLITHQIEQLTGRAVGFNPLHTTLQRLEAKGLLSSSMGGATAARGGRRKRYFSVTAAGRKVLWEVKQTRTRLWEALPEKTLQLMGN